MLNWRWIVAAALVAALSASHLLAYRAGSASTQAKWDAQIAQQALETQKLVEDARERERELQEAAEKLRKAKNAEIHDLATKLADALDGLRNRPRRPSESDLPSTSTTGAGCTGANLYREDAAFLTREANRADRLLADLRQCQEQYAKARSSLK